MTKGYLYIPRITIIDRSEAKTNEFLAFTFLAIDSPCLNRCLHDFTAILSRSVAPNIVKAELLKTKNLRVDDTLNAYQHLNNIYRSK